VVAVEGEDRMLIDHLVYAVSDLRAAVADLEERLGVRARDGGRHTGLGTHNALLSLGPQTYLAELDPCPLVIVGLASLAVPGIVSRRRDGVPWWRYDEEEVDVFLDKVIAVLSEGGQPAQAELRGAHFTTTRLRPGYVRQDVDGFLHEIARASLS
jgi:hypothetical protein